MPILYCPAIKRQNCPHACLGLIEYKTKVKKSEERSVPNFGSSASEIESTSLLRQTNTKHIGIQREIIGACNAQKKMFFSYVRCSLKEQSFRLSMLSTIFYNLEKKLLYQTRLIVKSLVFLAILPMLPVPSCCSNLFLEKGPFPFISSLDSVYFSSICNNMAFTR